MSENKPLQGYWIAPVDDQPILEEMGKQTDRAAALIATSYLEERLYSALLARLARNKDAEKGLFSRSRPLSSFSARIDLGVLIGLYHPNVAKLLHTIREIRNEFAHVPKPRDFKNLRIKTLCDNISIKVKIKAYNRDDGKTHRFHFSGDGTPRGEFISTIKYRLLVLDMETKKIPLRVPTPPIFPDPAPSPNDNS